MNRDDKLKNLIDLLHGCLLPESIKEFDTTPINPASFQEFHKLLNFNLTTLFDLIQQNEIFLIDDDKEYVEIKYNLIVLLCEQTANNTLYQTKDMKLLNNLNKLVEKYFLKLLHDKRVEEGIQNYYKSKLTSKTWKKYIGAASGFYRYLQIHYESNNNFIDSDFATFVLSVGLLFKDFYDPYYKEIGINILIIILNHVKKPTLISMNLPSIIFKETFDEITKLDTKTGILSTWTCLYDSLILIHDKSKSDFSKWSEIDDFLKSLIYNIVFVRSSEIWLVLFRFVLKISRFYSTKESNFNINTLNYDDLRACCFNLRCFVMLRWVKELLEFYVRESNYLMGKSETAIEVLKEMHMTYLFCIFPLDVEIIEPHLIIFLEKFSLILTETLKTNRAETSIRKEIKEFFQTFIHHLERSGSEEISQYKNAFTNLIHDECFI